MLERRVVVARQRDAIARASSTKPAGSACERNACSRCRRSTSSCKLSLGETGLAAVVDEELLDVAELALPGRVVHQRHQVDRALGHERLRHLDHIGGADFAAQMGEVLGAQQILGLRLIDRFGEDLQAAGYRVTAVLQARAQ